MRQINYLLALAVVTSTGCHGFVRNGTGADWGGDSTKDQHVGLVAMYESTPSLRAEIIDIDDGMNEKEIGKRHKTRWNRWGHRANVETCESDTSVMQFSAHVKSVVVFASDGTPHILKNGKTINLGNGVTITGTNGQCP